MKEKGREIGDTNDPYFQRGMALGLRVLDPLSQEYLTEEIRLNRDQFLHGYQQGLKKYIEDNKIILPMLSLREDSIRNSNYLLGYSKGLRRVYPSISSNVFGEQDEDLGEVNNGFRSALNAMENIPKSVGYFVGFLVSVVRDYGIMLDRNSIPSNNDDYAFFMAGFEGKPFDSISDPYADAIWADECSRNMHTLTRRSLYAGGLKIRSLDKAKNP